MYSIDFGMEVLERFMAQCKFPWLLSNVMDKCTGQPLAGAKQSHLIDWDGVKVRRCPTVHSRKYSLVKCYIINRLCVNRIGILGHLCTRLRNCVVRLCVIMQLPTDAKDFMRQTGKCSIRSVCLLNRLFPSHVELNC